MKDDFLCISLCVCIALLIRLPVSWNGYSGKGIKPLHGDYEAQRHWMEITWNLPIGDWYQNTTDNDLQYWGLDYPPLTAYHSWICGAIASRINTTWIELYTSRGIETPEHKTFMRTTALVAELLVFVPALVACFSAIGGSQRWVAEFAVTLLYPGLILIDHGHFQYNSVSLGLALAAVAALLRHRDVIGSVLFCLALCYKQMELYHAPVFFFFLLGRAKEKGLRTGLGHVVQLGVAVLLSVALVCAPFLTSGSSAQQLLTRVFPFNRGLFEDKVASFWCTLSIAVKIQRILPQPTLVKLCGGSVLIGLLPTAVCLLKKPSSLQLRLGMVTSSMVFFLFSYHVHEKSILLAAVPCCLLLRRAPVPLIWLLAVTSLSMTPLLIKDGLWLASQATVLIFICTAVCCWPAEFRKFYQNKLASFLLIGCLLVTWLLCLLPLLVRPPTRYPDLWPVLLSAACCIQFCAALLALTVWQLRDAKVLSATKDKAT